MVVCGKLWQPVVTPPREAGLLLQKCDIQLQLLAVSETDLLEIAGMGYSIAEVGTPATWAPAPATWSCHLVPCTCSMVPCTYHPVLPPGPQLLTPGHATWSCHLVPCTCCMVPCTRGVQAAFLEIKSNLKPNQGVTLFSSQASNQIGVSKNCQIKPQIKSGR